MTKMLFSFDVGGCDNAMKPSQIFNFLWNRCQSDAADMAVKMFTKKASETEEKSKKMVKAKCAFCEGKGYTWHQTYDEYQPTSGMFKHVCSSCKGLGYLMLEAYVEKDKK